MTAYEPSIRVLRYDVLVSEAAAALLFGADTSKESAAWTKLPVDVRRKILDVHFDDEKLAAERILQGQPEFRLPFADGSGVYRVVPTTPKDTVHWAFPAKLPPDMQKIRSPFVVEPVSAAPCVVARLGQHKANYQEVWVDVQALFQQPPPLPAGPSNPLDSRMFWSTHAFVFKPENMEPPVYEVSQPPDWFGRVREDPAK